MRVYRSLVVGVIAALALVVGACGSDDDEAGGTDAPTESADTGADAGNDSGGDDTAAADDGDATPPPAGAPGGTATFGGEALTINSVLCFFEEQPRAGLGGVFTHTLQASGTNAAGEQIVIDMSRARGDDGVVTDDISYDVGDPFDQETFVGWSGGGPEGTLGFGDRAASGTDVEMTTFDVDGAAPTPLSFELTC